MCVHKKSMALPVSIFTKLTEPKSIACIPLTLVSPKWGSKCGKHTHTFIYTPEESMAFTVTIFTELTLIKWSFVDILYRILSKLDMTRTKECALLGMHSERRKRWATSMAAMITGCNLPRIKPKGAVCCEYYVSQSYSCHLANWLANADCHTAQDVGLRLFTCWDCGFESCQGHECLSPESFACCRVQV